MWRGLALLVACVLSEAIAAPAALAESPTAEEVAQLKETLRQM